MIRVGFVMPGTSDGWLGGVSYYRNLLGGINEAQQGIEPVILTSASGVDRLRSEFRDVEVVATSLVDSPTTIRRARRALQSLLDRELFMESLLRRERIDLLSHSGYLGRRSRVPSMAWIPDFQERAFPSFFSAAELAGRARNVRNACRHATTVILSSHAAKQDLEAIAPDDEALHEVLPFVANVPSQDTLPQRAELKERYALPDRYFHLPNQFWVHKNHRIVLQALALLKREGLPLTVLATGNASDHRQPGHFEALMEEAKELDVFDLFRPLGMVPFGDLMSLMRYAVAVINPSKFEGWSTTVEEAKSMGKAVVLSDILVHREQAPERGVYFPPDDAPALAAALCRSYENWREVDDEQHLSRAARDLPLRRRSFGQRYKQIADITLAYHSRRHSRESVDTRRALGS